MLYLKHLFLVHVISSVTVTHKKCVYAADGGSDGGGYLSVLNKPFILRAEPPPSTHQQQTHPSLSRVHVNLI